ncbi:FkbM family methyltransferase [Pseudoalteromonas sp. EB27]|jgi:FkbM family methyltransferase|uniref:FkbM family methyltransferase n=1 Tax=Pseudoalteromonas sp. EB27 TaxID=1938368 RepID=UPI000976CF99|nr:FkbM family methyltransferase [Pseudoalteromonas sp. EB27]
MINLHQELVMLARNTQSHVQSSSDYQLLNKKLSKVIASAYNTTSTPTFLLTDNITFSLPYYDMGNINTTHLFGIDELIILSFYLKNKNNYKNVLDLGANIGLHSIVLSLLDYQVTCFEADPETFRVLKQNLELNNCKKIKPINEAAASFDGKAEFTRVCENLTGSHLSGAKSNPYGELDKFEVKVNNIGNIAKEFDLIKIDIEGQEADVLTSISSEDALKIDFMMEINGEKNAKTIFDYSLQVGLNIFLQKNDWKKVNSLAELPLSHREGSVFLSSKNKMPW